MLITETISQIPTSNPRVYAFRVTGRVTADDMEAMARTMNAAFDTHDSVSMLLIFEAFEGRETAASLNVETIKAQLRSLANVDKYAVVGAPQAAGSMIEILNAVIPVKAETFDDSRENDAWAFVEAQPRPPVL